MQEIARISWFQKVLSFLFPIVLKEMDSPLYIQFVLKNNKILLNSQNANQSNGTLKYALHHAFSHFKWYEKTNVNQILILGFGLGSAYDLLSPIYPNAKFVGIENNEAIYNFYQNIKPHNSQLKLHLIDAQDFIAQCNDSFDLILIDIFNDEEIPDFIIHPSFWEQCHQALNPNGSILWNTLNSNQIETKHPKIHEFFDTFWDTITNNRFYWKGDSFI
jgi:spermidine synthase